VTNTLHFHSARQPTPSPAAAADALSPPQRGCRPGPSLRQALLTIRFVLEDEPDDDPDDDEFSDDDEEGEGEEDEENDDEDSDTETWQVSSLHHL
jgi:hypothetical protein